MEATSFGSRRALTSPRFPDPRTLNLWHDTGLVFTTTIGTMLDQHNIRRGFRLITRAVGLGEGWVLRELRHTFVSIMSAGGVPVEEIARLAGRQQTSATEVVYRRELRPVIATGAEIMDRIFSSWGSSPCSPARWTRCSPSYPATSQCAAHSGTCSGGIRPSLAHAATISGEGTPLATGYGQSVTRAWCRTTVQATNRFRNARTDVKAVLPRRFPRSGAARPARRVGLPPRLPGLVAAGGSGRWCRPTQP
jgi:hypothetical protein